MQLPDFRTSSHLLLLTKETAPFQELIEFLGLAQTPLGLRAEKPFYQRARTAVCGVPRSIGSLGVLVLALGVGMALLGLYGLMTDFGSLR